LSVNILDTSAHPQGKDLQTTSWNMERTEASYIVHYVGFIVKGK